MPVLDTNFLVALQSGDEAAAGLLREIARQPLLVPSVVAVEFLTPYGARAKRAREELDRAFEVVHTSEAWVETAARFRERLRKERRSIRIADFWIATWAVLHDTEVVTKNVKDYEAMGVATLSW